MYISKFSIIDSILKNYFLYVVIVCGAVNCNKTNPLKENVILINKTTDTIITYPLLNGHRLDFTTSHHQFYIANSHSPMATDSENFWTKEAFDNKLATSTGILGIGTASYGPIKGEICFYDTLPKLSFASKTDHIVEGNLNISSEKINILDCLNNKIEFTKTIKNGSYRVRVSMFNLASVIDGKGNDYYLIEVFPDSLNEIIVIKRFKNR